MKNFEIKIEKSQIPWLKVFTIKPYKELSDLPKPLRYELYDLVHEVETKMIEFYNPDKINISSFGNYLPHLHIHIQARFKRDEYFPESMWGNKQREKICLDLPNIEDFLSTLKA